MKLKNNKLKTLKDIATAFVNGKYEIRGVREDELKAEAVKRAKYYIALLGSCKFSVISYGEPYFEAINAKKGISDDDCHTIGRIVEIVEFNNLTEEDLK